MPHPSRSSQAVPTALKVKPEASCIPLTSRELDEAERLVSLFVAGEATPYEKGRLRSLEQIAHINGQSLHAVLANRHAANGPAWCNAGVISELSADGIALLLKLADSVARLNPAAGEIGAGMLVQLVTDAKRALEVNGSAA